MIDLSALSKCESESWSSLLLFALSFALLLFLFLWERVNHKEFSIGWIPLGCQISLMLVWHEDSTFECLHVRDVDVRLVFLIAANMRSCQIVTN